MPLNEKDEFELLSLEREKAIMGGLNDPVVKQDQGQTASNSVQQKPHQMPSVIQRVLRQIGLTGRYAIEGASAPFSAVGDLMGAGSSAGVSGGLTALGFPKPQGTEERLVGDAARGLAGVASGIGIGGLMGGAASPVIQGIGRMLQSQPALQAASGVAGGLSSGSAREMGGGPLTQLASGLAGGSIPSVPGMVRQGFSTLVQGGESNIPNINRNIEDFRGAGTTPTVGQATQTRLGRATESILSKVVGGAGPMEKKATAQANEIGKRAEFIARSIGKADEMTAGDIIEKGLSTGKDSFRNRFVSSAESLFNKLDQWIPNNKMVNYGNLNSALNELNADIPNAEAVSQIFKKPEIVSLQAKIRQDAISNRTPGTEPTIVKNPPIVGAPDEVIPVKPTVVPGAPPGPPSMEMPYEALKKIRTLAGHEMADINSSNTLRDKWKVVYAASSKDMEGAVQSSGKPAEQAFQRANRFWNFGMKRMENSLDSVTSKKSSEEVYNAAISGVADGATRINAVMRSLKPEERNVVRAKFINDLGLAAPGQQNVQGNTFSTERFLTNWNKIHEKSKMILFAGDNGKLRNSLDSISKAAYNIKTGSKVFSNPSGTAPTAYAIGETATVASSVLTQLMSGQIHGALATAAGAAGVSWSANMIAKLMTNPEFVNSLSKAIKSPPGRQAAILQAGFASIADKDQRDSANGMIAQ